MNYCDKCGLMEARLIHDSAALSKIILFLTQLINKCLHLEMYSRGLILGGHECLRAASQKCHLTRINLFTVNYCLFENGDVSITFNGKDHNIMLECFLHKDRTLK